MEHLTSNIFTLYSINDTQRYTFGVNGYSSNRYRIRYTSVMIPKVTFWQYQKYHLLSLVVKVFHLKLSPEWVLVCIHGKEERSGQKGIKNYSLKPVLIVRCYLLYEVLLDWFSLQPKENSPTYAQLLFVCVSDWLTACLPAPVL